MSNTEKRNLKIGRKLSLNRETLRTVSADRLEEVAGGYGAQAAATYIVCISVECWTR
jgi:hypothetical protein